MKLDRDQEKAVEMALQSKFGIMTGGPGTGKTTTLVEILKASNLSPYDIALAAPTGKAAKRMSEACQMPAGTIHRLLEYSPQYGGFKRNKENPLAERLIVIDEASMLDIYLGASFFSAVHPRAQVVLVGDKDQLPSVGPGNVLKDLIASGVVPVAELKTIHRQSENSWIPINAQRVNAGQPLVMDEDSEDFFVEYAETSGQVQDKVIELVTKTIPDRHGLDPLTDIQLLCPQRTTPIGVAAFNEKLQAVMNPAKDGGKQRFRVKDKVLHIRNNYKLNVFNGETGIVIDGDNKSTVVDFGDAIVEYDLKDMDDLTLAYAMTIHKSQGSEWPCVVLPIHSGNTFMLSRNLLYTGITRGKKLVYIVGNQKGISRAIRNNQVQKRYTALAGRVREALAA